MSPFASELHVQRWISFGTFVAQMRRDTDSRLAQQPTKKEQKFNPVNDPSGSDQLEVLLNTTAKHFVPLVHSSTYWKHSFYVIHNGVIPAWPVASTQPVAILAALFSENESFPVKQRRNNF